VRERDIERDSYVDMCHTLYIESLHRERDIERDRRELCENGTVCEKRRETETVCEKGTEKGTVGQRLRDSLMTSLYV